MNEMYELALIELQIKLQIHTAEELDQAMGDCVVFLNQAELGLAGSIASHAYQAILGNEEVDEEWPTAFQEAVRRLMESSPRAA